MSKDVRLLHACRLRDGFQEAVLRVRAAEKRIGVDIRGEFHAVVGIAVHVDGHVRDNEQVAVYIHELRDDPAALAHHQPSGHGKRPVEPRSHQHPAVFFRIQPDTERIRQLRFSLILNVGESLCAALIIKPVKSKPGTRNAITEDSLRTTKYFPPCVSVHLSLLVQLRIALRAKQLAEIADHMVAARAAFNKFQKLLCSLHGMTFLFVFLYHTTSRRFLQPRVFSRRSIFLRFLFKSGKMCYDESLKFNTRSVLMKKDNSQKICPADRKGGRQCPEGPGGLYLRRA